MVRKCDKSSDLLPILLVIRPTNDNEFPITFCKVGRRHAGYFPKGNRTTQVPFQGCDYFTKWVEAKSISEREVQKFVRRNIITRFGVPMAIVFDNGRKSDTDKVCNYYAEYGIQTIFMTVARPQTNGQAKFTIRWYIRTSEKSATWESPFMLVYGSEAVLPVQVAIHTIG